MADCILLYINGNRREVRGTDAALTLSEYLRRRDNLCGTKIACAEGDCGACTVLVGRPTEDGAQLSYEPIDSCIAFVYQMHRSHVVTVEGLSNGAQLTAVQQAMVDCHGSQCGFCTPGFVMSLHGIAESGAARLNEDQLRLGLSGNLCRCTGYSQIVDAGLSLNEERVEGIGERFDSVKMLAEFAELKTQPTHVNARRSAEENGYAHADVEVMVPHTLPQLLKYRSNSTASKVVAGATDVGVQHNHGRIAPRSIIYLGQVEDLANLVVEDDRLSIGASVRWSDLEVVTAKLLPEFHAVIERFGSPQVRQAGTLVGNLVNASPIADSIPLLYVAEAIIELASERGVRTVPVTQFYKGYKQLDLAEDEVMTGVQLPLPGKSVSLKLYKISKRRDMDISTVTAAFWIECEENQIVDARIAYGGVGPTVLRMPKSEAALSGREFSLEAMFSAGAIARQEVTPISDVRGDAAYRLQLVENLFVKCYHDLNLQPVSN